MKMNKLIGIIAIVAVIGLVFIGCDESESTGAPGLLSVKKPADMEALPAGVRAPKNIGEADSLVNAGLNFFKNYNPVQEFADIATFVKYEVTGNEYMGNLQMTSSNGTYSYPTDTSTFTGFRNSRVINLDKTSISGSVKFDESIINSFEAWYIYNEKSSPSDNPTLPAEDKPTSLANYIKINMDPAFTGNARMKGEFSQSWSSNLTRQAFLNNRLAETNARYGSGATTPTNGIWPSAFAVGDKQSSKYKEKTEFEISGGFVSFDDWYSNEYKIAGLMVTDGQSNGSWTLETKATNFWKGSSKDTDRRAYSFTIIDESDPADKYGAKITVSGSFGGNWSQRASKWEGGNQDTEALVYNNAGDLIFTVDIDESDWRN